MPERTIHLDPDPLDRHARKINIRPYRWYATVELDRDAHVVDALNSLEQDAEIPAAFTEAVDRVRAASIDRIWYEGYTRDFTHMDGPRWATLPVQFPHVEATAEALRLALLAAL